MPQYKYWINFKNVGVTSPSYDAKPINLKLTKGKGNLLEPKIGKGETKRSDYEPNEGEDYVEFESQGQYNTGARLVLPLKSKKKDDWVLITDKPNGKFVMRIYLKGRRGDTNVEVGVEEPPRPPKQKQKPEGK